MPGDEIDVTAFATAFKGFLDRLHDLVPPHVSDLRRRAVAHLGAEPDAVATLADELPLTELPNVQLALEQICAELGQWELLGLPPEVRHYGGFSLAAVLSGRMGPHIDATAPSYVNVPVDVDRTLPCVETAVYLLTVEGCPLVVLVGRGQEHGPKPPLVLEVMSADRAVAAAFLERVRALAHEHNVYRGKVLAFTVDEYGSAGITFHRLPELARTDVILPEEDLAAIEGHTLTVSAHAAELRAASRHLKRGLLLYGPPGTGKTLTVMYLCNQMRERTTLLLTGMGTGALGQAVAIARSLQPSMVVLEDVDLVALERTYGYDSNPLLFQLLNEMDGLAEDADVIFVLTTNRVELLEPALAARPGRVDQAVEIKLPDDACRRRLFRRYLDGLDHTVGDGADLAHLVERTEGVSAAFVKELVRRGLLRALDGGSSVVTATHLDEALTELLEHSAPVLRAALGTEPFVAEDLPSRGGFGPAPFG